MKYILFLLLLIVPSSYAKELSFKKDYIYNGSIAELHLDVLKTLINSNIKIPKKDIGIYYLLDNNSCALSLDISNDLYINKYRSVITTIDKVQLKISIVQNNKTHINLEIIVNYTQVYSKCRIINRIQQKYVPNITDKLILDKINSGIFQLEENMKKNKQESIIKLLKDHYG